MLTNTLPSRLSAAKRSYTTARADLAEASLLCDRPPISGDLVLARVAELGNHSRLETPSGRRAALFPGDEIVVCFGNRYAPDQFEALVPSSLGPCHLVAAGGLAAEVVGQHPAVQPATLIEPVGLLAARDGDVLNLARWALPPKPMPVPKPKIVAVIGSSMNSGKTSVAAAMVRSFVASGCAVGAAKVTGTGAGGDPWLYIDSGAVEAVDFTATGLASTYRVDHIRIRSSFTTLIAHLAGLRCEYVVVEVADGILQPETETLLRDDLFRASLDVMVFAAADAVGAVTGPARLREFGYTVRAASGLVSASPLALREARTAMTTPVLTLDDLAKEGAGLDLFDFWQGAERQPSGGFSVSA